MGYLMAHYCRIGKQVFLLSLPFILANCGQMKEGIISENSSYKVTIHKDNFETKEIVASVLVGRVVRVEIEDLNAEGDVLQVPILAASSNLSVATRITFREEYAITGGKHGRVHIIKSGAHYVDFDLNSEYVFLFDAKGDCLAWYRYCDGMCYALANDFSYQPVPLNKIIEVYQDGN